MTALHSLLVFLHVLAATLWMAAALWVSGDVRRTLAMGRPYADGLAARVPAEDPAARRMERLAGLDHALWLLALAGMVLPV